MEIFEIILSLCSIVGTSSIISGLVLKRINRLESAMEKRDRDRADEYIAHGDLLRACGKLTEANTEAIRVLSSEDACETELQRYLCTAEAFEHLTRAKFAEYINCT